MFKKILWLLVFLVIFLAILSFIKEYGPSSSEKVGENLFEFQNKFMQDMQNMVQGVALENPMLDGSQDGPVKVQYFGDPSPYKGLITINTLESNPGETSPDREFIVFEASSELSGPVSLYGWSLQSMVSGVRVFIPDAVEDLTLYDVNKTYIPVLLPGQKVIVNSGQSPIGVSFLTNKCTGFISSFQRFYPPLELRCPYPNEIVPPTPKNINTLGQECMSFIENDLQRCQYLTDELAEDYELSGVCKSALKGVFTYTFCRSRFKDSKDYFKNSNWRLFVGSSRELWNSEYDVIRLLDAEGRVVDVWNY